MANARVPSFTEEKLLRRQGYSYIAGIDEVGRGALAGPVMAAAVIIPAGLKAAWKNKVRDSKLLSPEQREALYEPIRQTAIAVGIGLVDCWTIESIGIAKATQTAMRQAVTQLSPQADALLIDLFHPTRSQDLPEGSGGRGYTLLFHRLRFHHCKSGSGPDHDRIR